MIIRPEHESAFHKAQAEAAKIEFWDAADLLKKPAPPIDWIIDDILPSETVGDFFGPPGEGKSTLAMSLILHLASDAGKWFGKRISGGPVVMLGGERSGPEALSRDLHRAWKKGLEDGALIGPKIHYPLFTWEKKNGLWLRTSFCHNLMEHLHKIGPLLILLDTLQSCAMGDPIDYNQQYQLGMEVQQMGRELRCSVLTVSHTNQASVKETLDWRLNYLSRSGGNGLPGAFRWICGLSRLRHDDEIVKQLNLGSQIHKKLVAFAVSKHNEMGEPAWSRFNPAIFEIMPDGGLTMVMDGEEVAGQIQFSGANSKDSEIIKGKEENRYQKKKNGQSVALAGGDDDWE